MAYPMGRKTPHVNAALCKLPFIGGKDMMQAESLQMRGQAKPAPGLDPLVQIFS